MAERSKKPKADRKEVVEQPVEVKSDEVAAKKDNWSLGGVFWGLLLITVGVLALLANFGVITLDILRLAQLWPLLLVVWGVSMLKIQSPVWRAVTVLVVIATLGFVTWVSVSGVDVNDRRSVQSQTKTVGQVDASVKKLDLSVDAGASKVRIDSATMNDVVRSDLESSVSQLDQTSRRDGDTQRVTVGLDSRMHWWMGGVRNNLDVTLTQNLPVVLTLNSGAADLKADLSKVMLDSLDLDVGAASADIRLGDRRDVVKVLLDAGASSVTLRIPAGTGVRVELDDGVSSKDLDGLEEKSEGVYETSNYQAAEKKVTVTGSIGATSFKISRY
jgi:hypothetical protein